MTLEASDLPRHRRAKRHRMALLGLFPAKDIVVWTPDEVAQWQREKAVEIFISYRRDDSSDVTGRVYDRLLQEFGRSKVFKDVDSIPAGADFQAHISDTLTGCNACLVVIGARWLLVCDEHGQPRIKEPSDHVRLEIETALQRGIRVILFLCKGRPCHLVVLCRVACRGLFCAMLFRSDLIPISIVTWTGFVLRSKPENCSAIASLSWSVSREADKQE